MPSEMVIASKFRNAQYFEENELRVTHEKQTNKQTNIQKTIKLSATIFRGMLNF